MTLDFSVWAGPTPDPVFEPFSLDESPFTLPPVIYPGKVPAAGLPHWLVVLDEDEDYFEIEHTDDCLDQYGNVSCDVEYQANDMGLDHHFHRTDRGPAEYHYTEGLIPGRYLIESWFEESYSYYYGVTEYDAGLRLVYPEEATT